MILIPISLLNDLFSCMQDKYSHQHVIAKLLYVISFLFYLPGEYPKGDTDISLTFFMLSNIKFYSWSCHIRATRAPLSEIRWSILVYLTFSDQKTYYAASTLVMDYMVTLMNSPYAASSARWNTSAPIPPPPLLPIPPSDKLKCYAIGTTQPAPGHGNILGGLRQLVGVNGTPDKKMSSW